MIMAAIYMCRERPITGKCIYTIMWKPVLMMKIFLFPYLIFRLFDNIFTSLNLKLKCIFSEFWSVFFQKKLFYFKTCNNVFTCKYAQILSMLLGPKQMSPFRIFVFQKDFWPLLLRPY